MTTASLWGCCSAVPQLWQGRNRFVWPKSIFPQPSTKVVWCCISACSPRVTRNSNVANMNISMVPLLTFLLLFFFLEWSVIPGDSDTSSLCSAALFSLLNDADDTHFFCCAHPCFYNQTSPINRFLTTWCTPSFILPPSSCFSYLSTWVETNHHCLTSCFL